MQILSKAVNDLAFLQAADGKDYSYAMEDYDHLVKDCAYNLAVCNETSWKVTRCLRVNCVDPIVNKKHTSARRPN